MEFNFTSLAKEVMFSVVLVCLSVGLFACEQHYSKRYDRIVIRSFVVSISPRPYIHQ